MRYLPNPDGVVRVGVVVSKKVGKAVTRNRIRRRLREALREVLRAQPPRRGFDLVVIARPVAAEASYGELKRGLEQALKKAGL